MTSMSEFIVQKITERHPDPTKRILCLSEATILERDPQTYSVSSLGVQSNSRRIGRYGVISFSFCNCRFAPCVR